jgi:hypothetical protein
MVMRSDRFASCVRKQELLCFWRLTELSFCGERVGHRVQRPMMAASVALADALFAESVLDIPFPCTVSNSTLAASLTAERAAPLSRRAQVSSARVEYILSRSQFPHSQCRRVRVRSSLWCS